MKNSKNVILILAASVIVLFAAFMILRVAGVVNPENTTAPTQESVSVSESAAVTDTSAQIATETETSSEESSAAESSTEEVSSETTETTTEANMFLRDGVWYLYLDRTAYTFTFKNSTKVDVAYFDENNVDGLDTKYSSASSKYSVEGNELAVENPINKGKNFVFVINNEQLYYGSIKLSNENEVSLEKVFNHFN